MQTVLVCITCNVSQLFTLNISGDPQEQSDHKNKPFKPINLKKKTCCKLLHPYSTIPYTNKTPIALFSNKYSHEQERQGKISVNFFCSLHLG